MTTKHHNFMKKLGFSLLGTAGLMVFLGLFLPTSAWASGTETAPVAAAGGDALKWGLIAAALAFGLGALGAGLAISRVGAAAMGAMSEKPEIGSQALIFVAMAEGIAVFGFIAALMILGKI